MSIQNDDYAKIVCGLSDAAPHEFRLPEEITSDVNGLTCSLDLLAKVSSRNKFIYTTKKIRSLLGRITNDCLRNGFIKASCDNDQVLSQACFNMLMAISDQPSQIPDFSFSKSCLRNVDQSNLQVDTSKSNAGKALIPCNNESSVISEVESDISELQSDSALASSSRFLTRLKQLESTVLNGTPDPLVTDKNLKNGKSLHDESVCNAVIQKSVSSKVGKSKTLKSSRKSKKAKELSGKVRKVQSHKSKIKTATESPAPRIIRNQNSRKRIKANLESPVKKQESETLRTDKSTKGNGINEESTIGTIKKRTNNSSKAIKVASQSDNNSKNLKVKPDITTKKTNKSQVNPDVNTKKSSKSEVKRDVISKKASKSEAKPNNTKKDSKSEVKSKNNQKISKSEVKPDNKDKTSKAEKPKSKKCNKSDVNNSRMNDEENGSKEESVTADPDSFYSSEDDSDFDSEPVLGTMSACMNSIKRKVPRQVGTATPPLRMFLSANSEVHPDVSESDTDSFAGVPMKLNDKNVVKRMAKANKPKEGVENTAVVLNKFTKTPEALKQIMKMKKTNDSDSEGDFDCSSFSEDC